MTPEQFDQRVKVFADAVKAEMFAQVAKPKQTEPWKPEMNAFYFSISADGDIKEWRWEDGSFDKAALSIGSVFLTQAAAEREVERRKVIQELRVLAGGFKPDWGNGEQVKWSLWYDHKDKQWMTMNNNYFQESFLPIFPTEDSIDHAITTLGSRLDVLLDTTE